MTIPSVTRIPSKKKKKKWLKIDRIIVPTDFDKGDLKKKRKYIQI